MSSLLISTQCGEIALELLPQHAPVTVAHVARNAKDGLYDGCAFYRSDFVIQMGTHGTGKQSKWPALAVNESGRGASNERGTMAVAHHDKPDNGSTEIFINLQDNKHLDAAYGGYAVFARVRPDDAGSWDAIAKIAGAVKGGSKPVIQKVSVA